MKYKVGDKVRIKSLDWYNENRNILGNVDCGDALMTFEKIRFCGKIVTISSISDVTDTYGIEEDNGLWIWTDEMIEGLVERNGKTYPYKIGDRVILMGGNRCATITDLKYNSHGNLSYYIKIDNDKDISIDYPTELLLPYDIVKELGEEETKFGTASNPIEPKSNANCLTQERVDEIKQRTNINDVNNDAIIVPTCVMVEMVKELGVSCPEGYEFRDENGNVINATKIVLEKKKKEYPKTYEECLSVLKIKGYDIVAYVPSWTAYEKALYQKVLKLRELIICRDAYWKIAGEELGLGKPWEPDWENKEEEKYTIEYFAGMVFKDHSSSCSRPFAFPTAEMRDAFYENFKEEIEECKELL